MQPPPHAPGGCQGDEELTEDTDRWAGLRTWRPVVMGRRGVVASNHPLATEAGLAILRRGGNAADAYIAAAGTLAVVEPHMSGLGGEGFALVYWAATGDAVVVNATGRAPMAATPELFGGGIPVHGPITTITPCLVDGWCEVHRRFGSLPLPTLLESAIYHAREGFAATRTFARYVAEQADALAASPATAASFLPDGALPALGAAILQPALARTLEALAAGGRDAFYEGEIARALAGWMQRHGGLLDAEDLRHCRCEVQAPIRTAYRGLEVLEAPPNSTGCVLLEELNVAEQFDLAALGASSELPFLAPDVIHTLVEIKKLCFADRERIADTTDAVAVVVQLLSKAYAAELAARIDPVQATQRLIHAPASSTDEGLGAGRGDHRRAAGAGETTYLAVADGQGNAISGIQSINDVFGAAVVAGDTGILLNNRMRYWHLEPGHANRLAPGKRVRHTMNPPMVLRDGRPYLVLGTPGADAQVQVNLQVLVALLDFGLDPQQAVEMARWQSLQPGTSANWPHDASGQLVLEDRIPAATRAELARRGHDVQTVGALDGPCSVNVLRYDAATGCWQAGSDPRRDGYALAF